MADVRFISYDGAYPNLCSGRLVLEVDGKTLDTAEINKTQYCHLVSGGRVWFTPEWDENVEYGPWDITGLPSEFEYAYNEILLEINDNVRDGCCGGCI